MRTSCIAPRALAATLAVLAAWTLAGAAAAAPVTLRVAVPRSTPTGDVVYVAGDFQGWNPGSPAYALAKQPDGRWAITLDLTPGAAIQFKFARGTWAKVEKGYDGEEIANRSLVPAAGATYDYTVLTWADLGTITGDVESFVYAPFLGGRRCWVYLPPGYRTSSDRYPVLYMHDGQNLFDVRTSFAGEWHVDESCDALIGAGTVAPMIVVGIENGPNRITEYTPSPDPGYGGGGGDAYLQAIRDVLLPYVDSVYRTRGGRASQWMCGSSLGGLISAYAGYAYDATWSRVSAMSPSYWWDSQQLIAYAQAHGKPALVRFYQDIGTGEGASAVSDLRAMRDVALAQGFVAGADFQSVEAAGAAHSESYWAQRFPGMLQFLASSPLAEVESPPTAGSGLALAVSPNPVRDAGRVAFTLAAPAVAQVELLDLAGRRVQTLANRAFGAGEQAVTLRRGALGAGVYWVRVSAGGTQAVRRIALLD